MIRRAVLLIGLVVSHFLFAVASLLIAYIIITRTLFFLFQASPLLNSKYFTIVYLEYYVLASFVLLFTSWLIALMNNRVRLVVPISRRVGDVVPLLIASFFLSYYLSKTVEVPVVHSIVVLIILFPLFSLLLPQLTELYATYLEEMRLFVGRISFHYTLPVQTKKTTAEKRGSPIQIRVTKSLLASIVLSVVLASILLYHGVTYFAKVQRELLRASLDPVIEAVEPSIVYRANKVVIYGKNLGFKPNEEQLKLLSQYGEVQKDTWTDHEIVFTVPLHWRDGQIHLWINKPVMWEGKKIITKSAVHTIRLIPTTESITVQDEAYFEGLKSLRPQTLKLNGYNPEDFRKK